MKEISHASKGRFFPKDTQIHPSLGHTPPSSQHRNIQAASTLSVSGDHGVLVSSFIHPHTLSCYPSSDPKFILFLFSFSSLASLSAFFDTQLPHTFYQETGATLHRDPRPLPILLFSSIRAIKMEVARVCVHTSMQCDHSVLIITQQAIESFLLDPANHDLLTIVKGLRNGLVYGTKVRFPHALVYVFRPLHRFSVMLCILYESIY